MKARIRFNCPRSIRFKILFSLLVIGALIVTANGDYLGSAVLDVDQEPIAPRDIVTYTIEYATGVAFWDQPFTVRLAIPPPLQFLSASDGGLLINGGAQWVFEGANALERGQRQLTARVDPEAVIGTSILMQVQIVESQSPFKPTPITSHIQPKPPIEVIAEGTEFLFDYSLPVQFDATVRNTSSNRVGQITLNTSLAETWWGVFGSFTSPLASGDGKLSYGTDGLDGTWVIDGLDPGTSQTVSFEGTRQGFFPQDSWLDSVHASARFNGSTYPVQSGTVLWINQLGSAQRLLKIDGISLGPSSGRPSQTTVSIRGSIFYDGLEVVFRSGDERIEVPSEDLDIASQNEIRTVVAFAPGHTLWTAYVIAPGTEIAQYVFEVGSPLQLLAPGASNLSGGFQCWLNGAAGRQVAVQMSTDLMTWTDLTNFIPTADSILIVDPTAVVHARTFYRARANQ